MTATVPVPAVVAAVKVNVSPSASVSLAITSLLVSEASSKTVNVSSTATGALFTPLSSSQTSPIPSSSVSVWSALATLGQLSKESIIPSPSVSSMSGSVLLVYEKPPAFPDDHDSNFRLRYILSSTKNNTKFWPGAFLGLPTAGLKSVNVKVPIWPSVPFDHLVPAGLVFLFAEDSDFAL